MEQELRRIRREKEKEKRRIRQKLDEEKRRIRQREEFNRNCQEKEEENECLVEKIKHYEDMLEKMRKVYEIQGTPEKMETCKMVNIYRGSINLLKMQHNLNKKSGKYSAIYLGLGIN